MNDEQKPIVPLEQPKQSTFKILFREIIIFALIAFCIVLPFRLFIAEPFIVDGASMDPIFKTGHYLIVDKISYRFEEPQRNSVVVFRFPKIANVKAEDGKNLIKRIIGLPGDTVKIDGNNVTITNKDNPKGFSVNQSYVVYNLPSSLEITLGSGEYFVMGDNRKESYDSRSWGILPKTDIIGRPILRLYPITQIGILPGDYTNK